MRLGAVEKTMPQRITSVLTVILGLAGVLALGVLIVLRIDARRAAATGPKWKRKLIAAGLALLAFTGANALAEPPLGATCYDMMVVRPTSQQAAADLAKQPAWQRLCQTWAQAQDVASGGMGRYPFDKAGQKKLLDVRSGSYGSASEVVREALRLFQEREQLHQVRLEELRKEIAIGVAQADRGPAKRLDVAALKARARRRGGKG